MTRFVLFHLIVASSLFAPALVWSAPSGLSPSDEPVIDEEETKEKSKDLSNPTKLDAMEITEPTPVVTKKEKKYQFKFNESAGPRIGMVLSAAKLRERKRPDYLIGFQYMMASKSNLHGEFGADANTYGSGHVFGSAKYIFSHKEKRRPFVKGGMMLIPNPADGLGAFLRIESYNALLGAGLEDLLKENLSIRIDIELIIGPSQSAALINFGHSWAW